jgi:hypothetical protein
MLSWCCCFWQGYDWDDDEKMENWSMMFIYFTSDEVAAYCFYWYVFLFFSCLWWLCGTGAVPCNTGFVPSDGREWSWAHVPDRHEFAKFCLLFYSPSAATCDSWFVAINNWDLCLLYPMISKTIHIIQTCNLSDIGDHWFEQTNRRSSILLWWHVWYMRQMTEDLFSSSYRPMAKWYVVF